ncbi:hypothetical protein CP533_3633 [Ophiocordyceps camponoti-saundersi (nom. inval.)]|nr:hypothetical protein CP533_3633 [Ophiocordyceps camponoti-saundersi (nom. inval.)]
MAAAFRPVNSSLNPQTISEDHQFHHHHHHNLHQHHQPPGNCMADTTPTRSSFVGQKPLPTSPFPPDRSERDPSAMSRDSMDVDGEESDADADAAASDDDSVAADGSKSGKKKKSQRFYCTDYPPCNLSFTRSEHLARHIRKHTGERPFQCHCSRRFSRLDNLRQHAQTVHVNEDIPIHSLAASGSRFQRQMRTGSDRARQAGNRARASTGGSAGGPTRGHGKSLSTSSIASISSVASSSYGLHPSGPDARRRPPPLVMAADPRARLSLESYRAGPDSPFSAASYRPPSPADYGTPTSATFSSTAQSSPRWTSGVVSPASSHSRSQSLYSTGSRTPGRRLSVPSGAHPFQNNAVVIGQQQQQLPHHHPPPPPPTTTSQQQQLQQQELQFQQRQQHLRQLQLLQQTPHSNHQYQQQQQQHHHPSVSHHPPQQQQHHPHHPGLLNSSHSAVLPPSSSGSSSVTSPASSSASASAPASAWSGRREPSWGSAEEVWRRRTWHPDSRPYGQQQPQPQLQSQAQNPQRPHSHQQQLHLPLSAAAAQSVRPNPPPPMVNPTGSQTSFRLPGIESFDPLPSPMAVEGADAQPPPPPPSARRPVFELPEERRNLNMYDASLQRGLTRLDIGRKTPPRDSAGAWASEVNQAVQAQAERVVRFDDQVGRHQQTQSAPSPSPTPRNPKRYGWYHQPPPPPPPPPPPQSDARAAHVDRMVHPNFTGFSAFPVREQQQQQQHNQHHQPPVMAPPQPSQSQDRPPHGDPLRRLEALVAVATSEGSTATAY